MSTKLFKKPPAGGFRYLLSCCYDGETIRSPASRTQRTKEANTIALIEGGKGFCFHSKGWRLGTLAPHFVAARLQQLIARLAQNPHFQALREAATLPRFALGNFYYVGGNVNNVCFHERFNMHIVPAVNGVTV